MNTDCPRNKACLNQKCQDPCPGTCGQGAICDVINHIPTCSCPTGTVGDAFVICRPIKVQDEPSRDPCNPSPCGPNSVCRVVEGHAVCSCQNSMIGSPPSCRPECVVSAECPLTQACLMSKCRDPCPGTCGHLANCKVVNHSPICTCPPRHSGDPFRSCYPVQEVRPTPSADPINVCVPSPCGPNSECRDRGGAPACSCLPNYVGTPPSCRPECTINPVCPSHVSCINQKCTDPCPGSLAQMLHVLLLITLPCVPAIMDLLEIRLHIVNQFLLFNQHQHHRQILVTPHRVDLMLDVVLRTRMPFVNVYQNIKEIRMSLVDQNVLLVLIVP